MPNPPIRCDCELSDCAYFKAVEAAAGKCDCSHPDKAHYMFNPCPLYKKEWLEKQKGAAQFRDMMRRKRQL